MHQNGGREKDKRGGEKIFAPVSQKERGESRSWIPRSFVIVWNSCSARVRIVTPRPSKCLLEKDCFHVQSIYLLFPARPSTLHNLFVWSSSIGRKTVRKISNVHQNIAVKGLLLYIICPSKYTKMHIVASDFSKIFQGNMPPDPLAGLGLCLSFYRLYAGWLVPRRPWWSNNFKNFVENLHLAIDQHPGCPNKRRRELWPRKWFLLSWSPWR